MLLAATTATAAIAALQAPLHAIPMLASPPPARVRVPSAPILLFKPPSTPSKAGKSEGTDDERGGRGLGLFTGLVTPSNRQAAKAAATTPQEESGEEAGELSIKELLAQYGVIALLFHFSVWVTSLASVYALLTFGLDVDALLPEWLAGPDEAEAGAAAAGVAGRIAATLAVVEGIGPLRLALTVAATPKVSVAAREYQAVRDLEEWAYNLLPGGSDEE